MFEQKYVSIHSEDRDIVKFPNSSEFEIELPQDYCNVQGVKLSSWEFPAIYNTFSASQFNVTMTFYFTSIIPSPSFESNIVLQTTIVDGLVQNIKNPFTIEISSKIQKISYILFELWVISFIGNSYIGFVSKETGIDLANHFNHEEYFFMAGIVYIISQIFKRGVELQEENELTV
jgi:hypothetical protein